MIEGGGAFSRPTTRGHVWGVGWEELNNLTNFTDASDAKFRVWHVASFSITSFSAVACLRVSRRQIAFASGTRRRKNVCVCPPLIVIVIVMQHVVSKKAGTICLFKFNNEIYFVSVKM